MWIVQVALRRPYTFIVAALLILLATPFMLRKTPVDVFPEIDIPVVAIMVSYNGLSAKEMNDRIITPIERNFANSVSDMEHTESQTLAGMGIIKVFFQPQVNQATAIAQIVASTQASLRSLPPGATPPTIIKYSATDLPVLQLGVSSPIRSEQELNEQAFNVLRTKLITVPGVAVTAPYGGRFRQVSIDLDGPALAARGLSAIDVVNALNVQNLMLPSGTAKIGGQEVSIGLNGSPGKMAELGDIPITTVNGATVYVRDVAQVRDGYQPQTNVVRRDGERGLLMTVLKNGGASTMDIIDSIRKELPKAVLALPEDITVTQLADQSVFVGAAIKSVVHEAIIAAALTAALLLLFLGNWRSTLIIAVSIPLSILCSLIVLHLLGQSINIMTLGGLALAVGILVDDATVELENVERHIHMGKPPIQAILDGAREIATPAFVATLCICIAFVPMFFLDGVAGHLFRPLAQAVVFAIMASYVISRTLVPTLVMYMMRHQARLEALQPDRQPGKLQRIHLSFDAWFERMRLGYTAVLATLLRRKALAGGTFLMFCVMSAGLYWLLGKDFFPTVDAGQMRLHVRAPLGTRLEEMPAFIDKVENHIRQVVGSEQIASVVDIVGGPYTPYNTVYNNNGTFDSSDAEIMVTLKKGHTPTADHMRKLRASLPRAFPGNEFYFQPADMISQTLNFGVSAPIDIQIQGNKTAENLLIASELLNQIRQVPGAVDTLMYQRFDRRSIALEMNRSSLAQSGLVARDVAQNVMVSLSSSFQTSPTYWLNPANGSVYNVAVQTPPHRIDSLGAMLGIPISAPGAAGQGGKVPQLLGSVVDVKSTSQQGNISHYNIANVIDLYVGVDGRDMAGTYADIEKLIDAARDKLPRGSEITVRGQINTLHDAFTSLGWGLAIAIVLVYLLIVVNFQSWIDAAIIITALPAALAGIAWMLYLTGTTLSVPALTGAIMTVGVATANSILMVSFARQRLQDGVPAIAAALEAGSTRLRPVLMTALAMIFGMLPMALGLGEGGEQNAPLGRAVIGGLTFATLSTLLFVPLVYAGVHERLSDRQARALAQAARTAAPAAGPQDLSPDLPSAYPSALPPLRNAP